MIDARLRDTHRRARTTGALDDEARHLVERLRAGELTRTRLELAASCGHAASARALGVEPPPELPFVEWVEGLERFGPEATGAAILALARVAARADVVDHPRVDSTTVRAELAAGLDALEDYVASPTDDAPARRAMLALRPSFPAAEALSRAIGAVCVLRPRRPRYRTDAAWVASGAAKAAGEEVARSATQRALATLALE